MARQEITTPENVRKLQRTLYLQAKKNPRWQAWSLYGDLSRTDILDEAMRRVKENGGSCGIDGIKVETMAQKWEGFRDRLQKQLVAKTYRPAPIRRVWIPKANGGERPLGIPTVEDRVVQTALVILLEPIFEADFHPESYGYRPRRSAQQAIDSIAESLWKGNHAVIDADLSGYFDTIPHGKLLKLVRKRVSDGSILKLIKTFLRVPVVEEDGEDRKRTQSASRQGTPQGGVISPLLANLYLTKLDWAVNEEKGLKAKLVRYADDFVVLTQPGQVKEIQQRLKAWLEGRGLRLNEKKSRVIDFRQQSFEFLGYRLHWRKSWRTQRWYPHVEPSPKSCQRLREKVRQELNHWTGWKQPQEVIPRVNQIVRGWTGYFNHRNAGKVLHHQCDWLEERLRTWLRSKYLKNGAGRYTNYPREQLYAHYGLMHFPPSNWASHASR